ncbi:hypothetical protein Ct61P_04089 [Colletotrichum tofieldiae]|nr:hypothetical protein Ct61P_04089 [Colletotrichum tofieldiae]
MLIRFAEHAIQFSGTSVRLGSGNGAPGLGHQVLGLCNLLFAGLVQSGLEHLLRPVRFIEIVNMFPLPELSPVQLEPFLPD